MRYLFVTNQQTYTDTQYNDSWYGLVQCHVEDENGKVVDTYVGLFNEPCYYYVDVPGEPQIPSLEITLSFSHKEAWSNCFLAASNKWQPLDFNYGTYEPEIYKEPICKNKSLRECAELIICKREQKLEELKEYAIKRKQAEISQKKINDARRQAEREEAKKLKELQQKQREEEAARLKREEEAKKEREERIVIYSFLVLCIIFILLYVFT
jgi:hypothetical protein